MKIYTITFCNTTNVGAALQEYALQKYLRLKGHDTVVVNYIPKIMARRHSVWSGVFVSRNFYQFLKGIALLPIKMYRKTKYILFYRKYIRLSNVCHSVNDIEKLPQPDIYIVGSDQIWNDALVNWAPGYFLQFKTTAKKAAYAASAGNDVFSDEFLLRLQTKIQDFDDVSVREENLQKELAAHGMPFVRQVLDPVFLLSKKHYELILKRPRIDNFILLYETEKNKNCILAARYLAKHFDLKIVQMNCINNRYRVDRLYPCVSPTEFLGLVKYADYIVTNSFHAVALSLILEKQFWVIELENRFSRLKSILKIAGLENRILKDFKMDVMDRIDYKIVNKNLRLKKKESKEFLENIIAVEKRNASVESFIK